MWSLISVEFFVIKAIVFSLLSRYIAKQKNRSGAEGFWLGLLFSALGVIIVALLPKKEEKQIVLLNKEGLPKDEKTILYVFFILVFLFISFIIYSINNS